MSRLRTRLERLERLQPAAGTINWDNLLARSLEEIVPDGIVDWYELFRDDNATCPIEEAIRRAGQPRDPSCGERTPPRTTKADGHE
jgi:hypothetical protein